MPRCHCWSIRPTCRWLQAMPASTDRNNAESGCSGSWCQSGEHRIRARSEAPVIMNGNALHDKRSGRHGAKFKVVHISGWYFEALSLAAMSHRLRSPDATATTRERHVATLQVAPRFDSAKVRLMEHAHTRNWTHPRARDPDMKSETPSRKYAGRLSVFKPCLCGKLQRRYEANCCPADHLIILTMHIRPS